MADKVTPIHKDKQIQLDKLESDLLFCRELVTAYLTSRKEFLEEHGKSFNELGIRAGRIADWSQLEFFNEVEHERIIRDLAKGLTLQEIMDYFGMIWELLPPLDMLFVAICFIRGRAQATSTAVGSLFTQMNQKGGTTASLTYLHKFSDEWANSIDDIQKVKSIKVELIE